MPPSRGIEIPERVAERAFTHWELSPTGCYISTYSTASHGYAQVGWQDGDFRTCVTAHRAAWVHVHGQIPIDMTVDHKPTCDKRCVNVEHLRLLTNFENARRSNNRDWPIGECANGHSNEYLLKQWIKSENRYRLRCGMCIKMDSLKSRENIKNDPIKARKRKEYDRKYRQKKRGLV